eukprot:gnl/MRDRNA2_/MRDRNA2_93927_c0_seq1.p1 gnl/MRDRNA2_/MRDRNA2_93927_c0~~gnl/MRDRNA2_/MRDRNA2_93927_c0_seq1.p1  ORF type:complete len:110 (-),score=6.94 gnl/MRDRNA2_/MRDRNA2_93927_c0_seq1:57-347(-)
MTFAVSTVDIQRPSICSDLLLLQCRWQRLCELVGLVLVLDHKSVEVSAATDFELRLGTVPLYLNRFGILAACHLQELTDLRNLLWHWLSPASERAC